MFKRVSLKRNMMSNIINQPSVAIPAPKQSSKYDIYLLRISRAGSIVLSAHANPDAAAMDTFYGETRHSLFLINTRADVRRI